MIGSRIVSKMSTTARPTYAENTPPSGVGTSFETVLQYSQEYCAISAIIRHRAVEKASARERDEERLRQDEISPSELQRANLAFRGFRQYTIDLQPKSVDYVIGFPEPN